MQAYAVRVVPCRLPGASRAVLIDCPVFPQTAPKHENFAKPWIIIRRGLAVANLALSPKPKPDTFALATGGWPALRSLTLARAAPPPSVVATSPLRIQMGRYLKERGCWARPEGSKNPKPAKGCRLGGAPAGVGIVRERVRARNW